MQKIVAEDADDKNGACMKVVPSLHSAKKGEGSSSKNKYNKSTAVVDDDDDDEMKQEEKEEEKEEGHVPVIDHTTGHHDLAAIKTAGADDAKISNRWMRRKQWKRKQKKIKRLTKIHQTVALISSLLSWSGGLYVLGCVTLLCIGLSIQTRGPDEYVIIFFSIPVLCQFQDLIRLYIVYKSFDFNTPLSATSNKTNKTTKKSTKKKKYEK